MSDNQQLLLTPIANSRLDRIDIINFSLNILILISFPFSEVCNISMLSVRDLFYKEKRPDCK